jgi:hypothetical protein
MTKIKWFFPLVIVIIYLSYSTFVALSKPKVNLGKEYRPLEKSVQELLMTEDSFQINQGIRNYIIHVAYIENNDSLALKLIPFFKSEKMKKNWKERINKKIIDKKEKGVDADIYNLPHEIHEIE